MSGDYDRVLARVRALGGEAFGTSVEGEPLLRVVLGGSVAETEATVLVIGGLHAMEHVGTLAALALAERVAATGGRAGGPDGGANASGASRARAGAPGVNDPADAPWRRRRLVVVPLANPDGFRAVLAARARGARGFHRANARGVDLNRNFAAHWNDRHWLTRLLPRVFAPGAAPLSEPETTALDQLAAVERPSVVVSLHAFGEWVYLPWAGSRAASPQLPEMRALAEAMVARMERPYRIAPLAQRSRFFAAHGAEIDHFHEHHGAWTFLFEIGAGPRAADPAGWLDPYRWYTPRADLLERDLANLLPALDVLAAAPLPARRLSAVR